MTDFGFHINPSSTIDLDKVDRHMFFKMARIEHSLKTCIACGSCSATCPAGHYSGMSVRKVIMALQKGQKIDKMLNNCMLCGKCTMVCPRGINTRNLLLSLCRYYQEVK